MKTIIVANQKGGSGKSTLVTHLAVAAERAGDGPALLTDTDPQGSTADWFNAREAQTPGYVPSTLADLSEKIEALHVAGAKWLFVDTAPAINDKNADLLKLADLIIVPLCASPNDLRALSKTLPLLHASGKPFVFVMTRVNPQARVTVQTVMALSEHGQVLQPPLRERVSYPTSMIDGRTAQEIDGGGPAGAEVTELWQSVKGRFADMTKRRNDKERKA
jgi:chromosome partitioning protein